MPFPLVLLLVSITLTWLSIYLSEKRNIFTSWLTPVSQRFKEFILGFLFMGLLCIVSQFFLSQISGLNWMLSEDITIGRFLYTSALDINSVLIEELLFRGVLLYALIKYSSQKTGTLVSAAAFGMYHWFSYGVFGNLLGMTLVFITTGFMGFVFAKAYAKTESIILPVGLHLGWNWINNSIFSNGPHGATLLIPEQAVELAGYYSIISFLWYLIVAATALLFLNSRWLKNTSAPD